VTATLVDVLHARAAERPDRTAYTFLDDGSDTGPALTYGTLAARAAAVGAELRTRCAPGDRALLLYPPGLEYVAALLGCWEAGVIAIPAYPPRANRSAARLAGIVADAQPSVALTVEAFRARVDAALTGLPTSVVTTDDLVATPSDDSRRITGDTVALLQYTSGSTGTPKGVVLTHDNLLHNLDHIGRSFGHTEDSAAVVWLPPYHDMGLVGGLLQPLFGGFPVTLMSPMALLRSPAHWLRTISRLGASSSGGPNFAYELAVRRVTPAQRAELDLSRWRLAFTGAEPVSPDTLRRFAEYFAPCGFRHDAFYPCYGLAEATLIVSGGAHTAPPVERAFDSSALREGRAVRHESGRTLVGCGGSLPDQDIRIVDPDSGVERPDGEIGEIWLRGASVAKGYWNRPRDTAAAFGAQLDGAGPFLRTGDLGFLDDGELFVTGRLKDLIILGGRNHYPQDVERTAQQAHSALRADAGAAFSVPVDGVEELVVVNEFDRNRADPAEVVAAIRAAVAEQHEVRVHAVVLIRATSVPRTTSGKVQRHRCREDFLAGGLDVVLSDVPGAPAGAPSRDELLAADVETRHRLLGEFLRGRVAAGLDSIAAVALRHEIETSTGVSVPLEEIIGGADVAELTAAVVDGLSAPAREPVPVSSGRAGPHPLSLGQQAIWVQHQLAPDSPIHHLACAVRVLDEVDAASLRESLRALAVRHEVLRTKYPVVDGKPVAVVGDDWDGWSHHRSASGWAEDSLRAVARLPFDLATGPVLRAHLFDGGTGDTALVLVLHHIAGDFWSAETLFAELGTSPDSTPRPRYPDFVDWQTRLLAGREGELSRAYWAEQLRGPLPTLRLPADRARPAVRGFAGAAHRTQLDRNLVACLRSLAEREGTTLFTVLLAAYQTLLHRYTGDEDVVVGAPVAGRGPAGLADLVGYVSTLLPMRARISGADSFRQVLAAVRATVLGALANQDHPLPLLVDAVGSRDPGTPPVFQTTFAVHGTQRGPVGPLTALALGAPGVRGRLGGYEVESIGLDRTGSQFDIAVELADVDGGFACLWTYNTDLFDASTVARLADHLAALLRGVAAEPDLPVGRLPLPAPPVQAAPVRRTRDDSTLVGLFERQATATPAATAFRCAGEQVAYAELNARANRLARHLRGLGVRRGDVVGVHLDRGLDLPCALLAVLKLGAACLPLDPAHPADRVAEAVRTAGADVVVSQRFLDDSRPTVDALAATDLGVPVLPDELAYLIFTSGSTGRPKGVALEHRQIVNRLDWMWTEFPFGADDVNCQKTSVGFVDSIWELFGALLAGVPTVVVPADVARDPAALVAVLADQRVTRVLLVPSLLRSIVDIEDLGARLPAPALWVSSGEALSTDLLGRFRARVPHARIVNLYGMSEAWDATCFEPGESVGSTVPIGRPIGGASVHVLDAAGRPVPVGVPGELHVGGYGVARGYFGAPALTAQRFVPDPFGPPGSRLYRTGDVARARADGVLEHLGRADGQVKVHGVRIETAEVEAALDEHDAVSASAVVARADPQGWQRLVGYVVPVPGGGPTTSVLRRHLRERLPENMVPSVFVTLPELPRTPTGKLDRLALPEAPNVRPELDDEFVAPRSLLERDIAAVWRAVLGVDDVGVHDNFFDLGGTSLTLVEAHRRIRAELGVDIPVVALFQAPTVAALANHLHDGDEISAHLRRTKQTAQRRRQIAATRGGRRSGGDR
jgi:amino acid adenylation domain-containing protein